MLRTGFAAIAALVLGMSLLAGCVAPTAAPPADASSTPTTGWTVVAASGVSAELPGPIERSSEEPFLSEVTDKIVTVYAGSDPSGRADVVLRINPLPSDRRIDPQQVAMMIAHNVVGSELRETRPVDVNGHSGLDARIDNWSHDDGGTGLLLLRIIDAPQAEVTVDVSGNSADAESIQQVFDQVCATIRIE